MAVTSDRVVVLEEGSIRQIFAGGQINTASIREALHDETNVV